MANGMFDDTKDSHERVEQQLQSFATKLNDLLYEMEKLKFAFRGHKQ